MTFKIPHLLSLVAVTFIVTSCTNDAEDFLWDNNSNSCSIEVESLSPTDVYPSVSEIISNTTVKDAMDKAWQETLKLASKNGRQEVGFFIYYDFDTKKYSIGETQYGPIIKGCDGTHASISLKPPTNGTTVCAFFHTHTPLTYCPNDVSRDTGPSQTDINTADSYGLPGILYDYSATRIYGGQSLNSPAKLYTFGVTRRKNPLTPNSISL